MSLSYIAQYNHHIVPPWINNWNARAENSDNRLCDWWMDGWAGGSSQEDGFQWANSRCVVSVKCQCVTVVIAPCGCSESYDEWWSTSNWFYLSSSDLLGIRTKESVFVEVHTTHTQIHSRLLVWPTSVSQGSLSWILRCLWDASVADDLGWELQAPECCFFFFFLPGSHFCCPLQSNNYWIDVWQRPVLVYFLFCFYTCKRAETCGYLGQQ